METLLEKARRLQSLIEHHTLQTEGLLPMFVRAGDYQLPTAADYAGAYRHRHLRGKTESELDLPPMHIWRAWENSLADTSFYLGAASYQYRCTHDPAALSICRRTLRALRYVYDLCAAHEEPGHWCKPYGGAFSYESSGDQLQCLATGLYAYREIAPPDDRATIDEMTAATGAYLVRSDYVERYGYFDYAPQELRDYLDKEPLDWWGIGLIHLPMLALAWEATGDVTYVNERHRWYRRCGLGARFTVPDGVVTGLGAPLRLHLAALAMEIDPQQHELWRDMIRFAYSLGRHNVLPDGTGYTAWTHDPATDALTPQPSALGGNVPARNGRINAIFAMGLVKSQRWAPGEDLAGLARTILDRLDEATFRFILPLSSDEPLPPQWRVESELLDHDALTAWLFAYWEGKWRGYW